ncbi:MAG: hypothetical protein IKG21_01440 [Atopobiaceae bacterium]|nr:hypothetical protein [Atopobiaceae bacterium]
MSTQNELDRFEADLAASDELKVKYEEARNRIAREGAANDAEVVCRAAAELGYTISFTEAERAQASMETLDDDALEEVAGGFGIFKDDYCWFDYRCRVSWVTEREDTNTGHDKWCATIYSCFTISVHDDDSSSESACWSNYMCVFSHAECYSSAPDFQ